MLYTSTVSEGTLDILKKKFQIKELENFFLVGGTNLSLRYGHRISVNIDLFGTLEFENDQIIEILERNFQTFSYKNNSNPIGVFGFIDNVKIDLVRHYFFNTISDTIVVYGIRMFGDQDIMAMKSLAILKRGVKKDFYDINELLNHYSIEDFIISHKKKYINNSIPISIPYALTYFVDADESEYPVYIRGLSWEQIKSNIQKVVREYLA